MKNFLIPIIIFTSSTISYSMSVDQDLLAKANNGDRNSQEQVAKFYEYSNRDGDALSWFYKAAQNGSGYAASKIAAAYENGLMGLKKDSYEALVWYKKGASLSDKKSLLYLASYNEKIKKYDVALNFINKCITLFGDKECFFKYGQITKSINGNLDKNAFKAFEEAAKLQSPEAYTELSFYYENGFIVDKSISKAHEYIKKASLMNEKEALHLLGNAYLYGNRYNLSKNESEGLITLEKAASLGSSDAYNVLGNYYFDNKDISKAIHYYKKAVDLNNYLAQWNLAVLYQENFLGNSKYNKEYYKNEIAKLLIKSADNGYLEAQLVLAESYDKGYYNLFSRKKAKYYYELAAKQGSGEAILKLKGFTDWEF